MSILLSDVLNPALRIAGITMRPGITPSPDQYGELIPAANRMLASWNCDGHKIFSTLISAYDLSSGQKIYTIGPGGDFNTARPIYIKWANFIFPGRPELRVPIRILEDIEWARIQLQDISPAPPYLLYYDSHFDGATGLANIYMTPQPPEGYQLELYTWNALKSSFGSVTDEVLFPPGYEEAIVWNLGLRAAAMYPHQALLDPESKTYARKALDALITLNSKSPRLRSEAAWIGRWGYGTGAGLVSGGGGGTGSANMQRFTITGSIDGTNGYDGNAVFTLSAKPTFLILIRNGEVQTPDVSYSLSNSTITFLAPNIPIVGDTLLAIGTT